MTAGEQGLTPRPSHGNMAAGERGSPPLRNFFFFFFASNYHASFVNTDTSLIVYRISTLACHA